MIFKWLYDLIVPNLCLSCGHPVQTPGLCANCWVSITFLHDSACIRCYKQFSIEISNHTCHKCSVNKFAASKLRAPLKYDAFSKNLIMRFKNGCSMKNLDIIVNWMQRSVNQLEFDAIVPVPLYKNRLYWRGYNQSMILAKALSQIYGKPLLLNALKRTKHTGTQSGLKKQDRQSNIKGAFEATNEVKGLRILLIDDVITTGSTVEECAKVLRKGGASEVNAVAIAKTR